jgi:hypothetical protein
LFEHTWWQNLATALAQRGLGANDAVGKGLSGAQPQKDSVVVKLTQDATVAKARDRRDWTGGGLPIPAGGRGGPIAQEAFGIMWCGVLVVRKTPQGICGRAFVGKPVGPFLPDEPVGLGSFSGQGRKRVVLTDTEPVLKQRLGAWGGFHEADGFGHVMTGRGRCHALLETYHQPANFG